jgi:hypothetical protein
MSQIESDPKNKKPEPVSTLDANGENHFLKTAKAQRKTPLCHSRETCSEPVEEAGMKSKRARFFATLRMTALGVFE